MNYFNYYTEIEETFVRRRGKNLLLSPIDWAMIEGWQERGVPLHVVIRGIETVFDGFDKKPSPRSIKGLLYCREEIEAQFQEWLAMQAGKPDGFESDAAAAAFDRDAVFEHIERVIAALRDSPAAALREDLERATVRLREIAENLTDDFEAVDKSLCDVESFLDHALLTKTDPRRLKDFESDIKAQLKPYKSTMDVEAYKKTFDLMLLKRLREEADIPRFSLFYI